MFGLFRKKDPIQELQKKYEKLMSESHKLSHTDRTAADKKAAEAEEVLKELEQLKKEREERL